MAGFNRVTLVGNLADDPKLFGEGNNKVCNMRVASENAWRTKDGESKSSKQYFTAVCFGERAVNANEHGHKGRSVVIDGRLQNRSYDKDGAKVWVTEIVADTILFLDAKASSPKGGRREEPPPPADDDIPF